MSEEHDLIIVGAGPAGLMASITAAEGGLGVLLVERKKNVSKVRRSCCALWATEPMTHGETIAVEEKRVVFRINDFAVDYTGDRIPLEQNIRFSPGGKKLLLQKKYEPIAIAFDKEALLREMLAKAESLGVRIAPDTHCVDALDEDDKVSVKLRKADSDRIEYGRYLILADGVNSAMGARLGFEKDRTFYGTFKVYTCHFNDVDCPYPYAWMNFVGKGHLNGAAGNIYVRPKPGVSEHKNVFEIHVGQPVGPPENPTDIMTYFVEQGSFSKWFKHARPMHTCSAVLNFRSPIATPARGRTLVAGDAAAFIETFVQAAIVYGRSAAKAVLGKIREGKDFSDYVNHWRETFDYNKPGVIERATSAYGINRLSDDELDYLLGLTDDAIFNGYYSEVNSFFAVREAFSSYMGLVKKEKPELGEKLEAYFNTQALSTKERLSVS